MQNEVSNLENKPRVRIGTAGWSIPAHNRVETSQNWSVLEKYAMRFNAVEINSSFYRSHTQRSYKKWASQVKQDFLFSVKLPRLITHYSKLSDIDEPAEKFASEVSGLGSKLGCVLVQLPPSLEFLLVRAKPAFSLLRKLFWCKIVCEPRHLTWFSPEADAFLIDAGVARVAADPALCSSASVPGGDPHTQYHRLHGSPRRYYSNYSAQNIEAFARLLEHQKPQSEIWCIFDNSANGCAFSNALTLQKLVL